MSDSARFDFDILVVGSGFGGSVSALRLTEKGYRVGVLEQGKRFGARDFAKTNWDVRRYLWAPVFKCFGIQRLTFLKDVLILSGAGVGGGSLVYANTLMEPSDGAFQASGWRALGSDAQAALAPFYALAKRMLGATLNPKLTFIDAHMREYATKIGAQDTFQPTTVAVFFGEPGKTVPDPYFNGEGPERTGCISCGGCMVGCRHGAKNTLDKNYLYLAEKRGARILPERKVTRIVPLGDHGQDGYELHTECSTAWFAKRKQIFRARQVVLAGGVLGTVDLLLRARDVHGTLPDLSVRLGHTVRTNSEVFTGTTELDAPKSKLYSEGIAISSIFRVDPRTSIEPVRYPAGSNFMKLLAGYLVEDPVEWRRTLKFLKKTITHLPEFARVVFNRRWAESAVIFLVMQDLDNRIRLRLGRGPTTLFRRGLLSRAEPDADPVPSEIPSANAFTHWFSQKVGGISQCAVTQVTVNVPTTAHILGGCGMGQTPDDGVIDAQHRVFNYQGLYVCDGSAVPANLGVNPSLTITAMTERAMSLFPPREGS